MSVNVQHPLTVKTNVLTCFPALQVACHFRCMWVQHAVLVQWRQLAQAAREAQLWEHAQAQAAAREEQVGCCPLVDVKGVCPHHIHSLLCETGGLFSLVAWSPALEKLSEM